MHIHFHVMPNYNSSLFLRTIMIIIIVSTVEAKKKLTLRFRATKSFVSFRFRFVSVSFPFYHDGILKSIVFVPIFRFAFSVFPSFRA